MGYPCIPGRIALPPAQRSGDATGLLLLSGARGMQSSPGLGPGPADSSVKGLMGPHPQGSGGWVAEQVRRRAQVKACRS